MISNSVKRKNTNLEWDEFQIKLFKGWKDFKARIIVLYFKSK